MSDVDIGMRSLQLSGGAAAICGFCGYFAARQLTKPFIEESSGATNRAMIIGAIGIIAVMWATVYAMFVIYRASMRTKMFAVIALLVSLGGGYGGWTVGWKKGGAPDTIKGL
jgi:hypothetical protein